MRHRRAVIAASLILSLLLLLVLGYLFRDNIYRQLFRPTGSSADSGLSSGDVDSANIEILATGLQIPWEVAFLPDNQDILISERTGSLKRLSDGKVFPVNGVAHVGEGGLLGLALHPDFSDNQLLYLYLTTRTESGLTNRVERYKFGKDNVLSERKVLLENIPGASVHDGGRLAFGPDRMLYITTGDAGNSENAQNVNSLAGKVLRLTADGQIPGDNPFGNAVYSYGHRNPQGLAWDSSGRLWSTEHGPSGLQTGYDELNLIRKGGNYGWPVVKGDESRSGMISPVLQSGSKETWAPASLAYADGALFFGGLRGEALYEARLADDKVSSFKAHFRSEYGRLRAVVVGPDGKLYITTSNTDGRGEVREGDDKLIKLDIKTFD